MGQVKVNKYKKKRKGPKGLKAYIRPGTQTCSHPPASQCLSRLCGFSLTSPDPVKYCPSRRRDGPPPPASPRRPCPCGQRRRGQLRLRRVQPDPPRHRPRGLRARVHRLRRARPYPRRAPLRTLRRQVSTTVTYSEGPTCPPPTLPSRFSLTVRVDPPPPPACDAGTARATRAWRRSTRGSGSSPRASSSSAPPTGRASPTASASTVWPLPPP